MKKLIIANWKSNKTREEVVQWMDEFGEAMRVSQATRTMRTDVVICPPMPSLMFVSNRLLDRQLFAGVALGVQDLSPFAAGSYTGAVSTRNLEGFDVRYSIVGHSERRRYFHETAQDIANKVEQCLEAGITPIVCVDQEQIEDQAAALDPKHFAKLVVAYEPVEHIGTGVAQEVSEVLTMMTRLRAAFPESRVIYGGSVNPENLENFSSQSEIEGFLVGTASLSAADFYEMIQELSV